MTSLEKEENAGQSVDNLDESKDKKKKTPKKRNVKQKLPLE